MKGSYVFLCLGLLISPWVQAHSEPPGSLTELWLSIQREGSQASNVRQSATPVEQQKSAERWLKTFEYEIPEVSQDTSVGGSK